MSEVTKTEAILNRNARNQEAIVLATIPQNFKPRRYEIPGGIHLRKNLDTHEKLTDAFHNWLRVEEVFTKFTFSLTASADYSKLTKERAEVLPKGNDGLPIWQSHPDRRMYLALILSKVVGKYKNLVALEVTADGVDVYLDPTSTFNEQSEDWSPNYSVTPNKAAKGQYAIRA
jgi:hypothetical protein